MKNFMEKEFSNGLMDLDMKVNFIKIFVMGLESGNHLLKNKLALKHSTLDSLKII